MTRAKVLLVDDSALVRAVVAHALPGTDYELTSIDDPRKLAEEIPKVSPDLLLVDASYPGVTDEMLVALVAAHSATFPVVLFSDRAEAEVQDLVARIAARGYVPKDGASLARRLKAFLTKPS